MLLLSLNKQSEACTVRKSLVKRPELPEAAPDHPMAETVSQFTKSPGKMPRKLMLQLLGMTAGLTLSAWGHAVGLGGINVVSALGQPLKAEIELVAVSKTDKPGLVARLASPDTYKGAGLDYPYGVKYSFQVASRANGEPYLKLSSNQEINDPFVSLLVELSWSSGKLMREYTFLLDPPGYVAEQPKPATVQPAIPAVVQADRLEKPEEARPVASTARPAEKAAIPVEKPAVPVEKRAARPEPVATGAITVKGGDTLNKIAARIKPEEVSLERMLVALYRANDDQFDGKNMNRIRSGKILRIPDKNELSNLGQAEALQEIHAQTTDWNAYRQKLAGAATTSRQSDAGRQVATGKVTSTAVDKAPVASESAREVLRLSKGETPGDKLAAAGRSAQDKKNAAAEDAISKAKAVEEGKTRAALLESNLKDMQRLAQLKSEAAALAATAAEKVAAASSVASPAASAVASEVPAASAVAAASQVAAASAVKAAAEPSLMDQFLASPLYMGIGAAALLVLGGLGIALGRRKQTSEITVKPADDEVGTITGHLTNPVMPSPDTGDFTAPAAEEVALHPDDVDPISEAELFLNFGRDEQAEEVLKDALQHSPDNHQVHLKLLGIYAKRQDAEAFAKVAQLLQDSGDIEAIQQAEILGQKLDSANPPHIEEASIEDADSATQLNKALKATEEATVVAEFVNDAVVEENVPDEAGAIDFDVTSTQPAQKAEMDFDVTSTGSLLAAPEVLDFDLAAAEPEPVEAAQQKDEALPSLDDLIFDVTSAPVTDARVDDDSYAEDATEEDDGMEFTLDFPVDDSDKKVTPQPPAINLADISLDMDDVVPAPAAEPAEAGNSEHWHEVATKLDLAKAYQEMGDDVGAREILDEVMLEGDQAQQEEARLLISQLG
jgi:pilus assembly protein FimV